MINEKLLRMHYYLPIFVDVERFADLYVAYLAGRPDIIGQGNHLMEALTELGKALLDGLGTQSGEAAS